MGDFSQAMKVWRDTSTCHYCNTRPSETLDHIIPRFYGGSSGRWNLVPSCLRCNHDKSHDWPSCECAKCQNAIRIFMKFPDKLQLAHERMQKWMQDTQQDVVYHRDTLIPKLEARVIEARTTYEEFTKAIASVDSLQVEK